MAQKYGTKSKDKQILNAVKQQKIFISSILIFLSEPYPVSIVVLMLKAPRSSVVLSIYKGFLFLTARIISSCRSQLRICKVAAVACKHKKMPFHLYTNFCMPKCKDCKLM